MKLLIKLLLVITLAIASASAASYSTDVTLSLNKAKTQYQVVGRVCRLDERDGNATEEVIANPRIVSSPGSPGSFYVGADRGSKDYENEENVSVDVTWPAPVKGGFAVCTVTVRRGDTIVAKATTRVQVNQD